MSSIAPYIGQTVRATASSVIDAGGAALTTPTVVFTITDPDGTVSTPSVTQSGVTWYVEFVPTVAGLHVVRVTATAGNGVAKEKGQLQVYEFEA